MTQQLGMMEEQEQQHQQHVADEDDGVSVRLFHAARSTQIIADRSLAQEVIRSIDADLQEVRHTIKQHGSGEWLARCQGRGARLTDFLFSGGRAPEAQVDVGELQRKWDDLAF